MERSLYFGQRNVPLALENGEIDDATWALIHGFKPFWDYCDRLYENSLAFSVNQITIKAIQRFGGKIGFMLVDAEIYGKHGRVPGAAFLRGDSVVVLVILRDETGKEYAVLTQQARLPVGEPGMIEVMAGTLDGDGNFAGKASTELQEEFNMRIAPEELINLSDMAFKRGVCASPGGMDEKFIIFCVVKEMARKKIKKLMNTIGGNQEEGEHIIIKIVPFKKAWEYLPDAKSLSAIFLYQKLRRRLGLTKTRKK